MNRRSRNCLLVALAAAGCQWEGYRPGTELLIPRGSKIAVLAYDEVGKLDMEDIARIEQSLLKMRMRVVDRGSFQTLIGEQRLGTTGAIRPDEAQAIGNMSGAQYIILRNITRRGNSRNGPHGSLRLLDVSHGETLSATTEQSGSLVYGTSLLLLPPDRR